MGTTPRLETAAATEPATSKQGMTPPLEQQLDQLKCMASLSNPVKEYTSWPATSSTTNHEMSKTPMVMVWTMFLIISTDVRCGT